MISVIYCGKRLLRIAWTLRLKECWPNKYQDSKKLNLIEFVLATAGSIKK